MTDDEFDELEELMSTMPGDVGTGWAPRDPESDHTLTVRVWGQETQQERIDDNEDRVQFEVREWCRRQRRLLPPVMMAANYLHVPAAQRERDQTRRDAACELRVSWTVFRSDFREAFPSGGGRPSRACLAARERIAPAIVQARRDGRTFATIATAADSNVQQIERFVRGLRR
ncbi:MAG: hypothetical protein QOE25_1570 [Actinomycetota bacterium]|jgi:hypothetical protein|nr:hypothetical protein [Actinomycetota bacterium]